MFGLSWSGFFRAVIAGFIATFVMEVTGFWQSGIGLARVDGAQLLATNARRHWLFGEYAHYMNGILLAIAYGRWFKRMVPGPGLVKGFLYGIVTTVAADGFVVPVIDPRVGPFFANTPRPSRLRLASLIVHLFYGVVVGWAFEVPSDIQVKTNGKDGC